jgi:hypothetical protein
VPLNKPVRRIAIVGAGVIRTSWTGFYLSGGADLCGPADLRAHLQCAPGSETNPRAKAAFSSLSWCFRESASRHPRCPSNLLTRLRHGPTVAVHPALLTRAPMIARGPAGPGTGARLAGLATDPCRADPCGRVNLRTPPQCAEGSATGPSGHDRVSLLFLMFSRFSLVASALPFQSVNGHSGHDLLGGQS